MRRSILLLMTIMLTAASIAIAVAASRMERPQATGTARSDSVLTVHRYYEAVNRMIATGDPASLRRVVHVELQDINALPARSAGRATIEHYLSYLHALVPEMRIEAEAVLGDGAEVVAVVAVLPGSLSMPLGFVLDQPSMLWPSHERFLVSGGQIVARQMEWSEPAAISRFDAFPTSFVLGTQHTLEVTLTVVEAMANNSFTTTETPAVLVMDSGNLGVALSTSASASAFVLNASFPANPESAERVRPGDTRTVGAGEVVIIPPDSSFAIQNQWADPALMVTVSVAVPPTDGAESATFALYPQPGIDTRSLLTLPVSLLAQPSHVQFGSVSMPPGSRLSVDPAIRLMAVWAESGALVSAPGRSTCVEAGFASNPRPAGERLHLLCPGGAEDPVALVNTGTEPTTAWVIAVTAVSESGRPAGSARLHLSPSKHATTGPRCYDVCIDFVRRKKFVPWPFILPRPSPSWSAATGSRPG